MFLQINTSNGIPVYDQIARQVMFAVADGALATGDLIPSVRELARELAVNPNTVARAYRELQTLSVVEPVPGTGLAVRSAAKRVCRVKRQDLLKSRVSQTLRETLDAGLDLDETRALIDSELKRLSKTYRRTGDQA